MKIKKEDVELLLEAIDDLVDLKIIIRKITPNYELNNIQKDEFISKLQHLYTSLHPIFSTYLKEESVLEQQGFIEEKREKIIKAFSRGNYLLVSSNSAKNNLKDLGADPRNIMVSGGPFFLEDYQKVDPNIPDHALEGIKKKCERVKEELKSKIWENNDLYFIYEKDDIADKLTLEKINQISDLIGKEVKTIGIKSWNSLVE